MQIWVVFIYVIAAEENGPCKIGFAKDPSKRLKQLQTGHPAPLRLWFSEPFSPTVVRKVERTIHETIKFDRSHGEWFDISVRDAIAEVSFATIRHADI